MTTTTAGAEARYQCRCGHAFDVQLGAFGCPECKGDMGRATLVDPANPRPPRRHVLAVAPGMGRARQAAVWAAIELALRAEKARKDGHVNQK